MYIVYLLGDRRGHGRVVVGFTTTYAINAAAWLYHLPPFLFTKRQIMQ